MRLSNVLHSQHIGRMVQFLWHVKGKIKVEKTLAQQILTSMDKPIVTEQEFIKPKEYQKYDYIGAYDEKLPLNSENPEWKAVPCYQYKDHNVLAEGLKQALVLTNTAEVIDDGLDALDELEVPPEVDDQVTNAIMQACVFDACQQKLPKRKDPLRPAWNFRRDYGIVDFKKNFILTNNLVQICDTLLNSKDRSVVSDCVFSLPIQAYDKLLQFELRADKLLTSSKPLPSVSHKATEVQAVPDLGPVHCTLSLEEHNFYQIIDFHPISLQSKWPFIHTAIVHHNPTEVKNLYEKEVLEHQLLGRTLMKGFTMASCEARARFGVGVQDLPEPVTVQVIQTDGRMFHFGVFQLNSLNLENNESNRNVFIHSGSRLRLYLKCEYQDGIPVLIGYDNDVFKRVLAFMKR